MYRLLKNKCLPEFLLKTKLVKEITRFWLKLTSIYFTESCENLINSCPSPFITKTIISTKHNILQNYKDRKNLRKIIWTFFPLSYSEFLPYSPRSYAMRQCCNTDFYNQSVNSCPVIPGKDTKFPFCLSLSGKLWAFLCFLI